MPSNFRVYYPLEEVAIGEYCSQSGIPVHGVQSVNMTTNFNLEQAFELGQIDIYENIENLPNIEMTLEKLLDGYPLIYHLASQGATTKTLANRTNQRADVFLSVFSDAQTSSSGQPMLQAYCSGMYINSLNYTLPVQGNCRESVSLVGNDKIWVTSTSGTWSGKTGYAFDGHFDGTDAPASGIQRRQHVQMGLAADDGSVWPKNIPGITVVTESGYNELSSGQYVAHIQDVTISANIGRTDLFELGRRRPYYRYANFPVAVDCTINVTAGGTQPGDTINANADTNNLTNEPILIKISDGTVFDLGTRNKLMSVSYSGGGTDGGVVTMAFNYQNFNMLNITNPNSDPEALS